MTTNRDLNRRIEQLEERLGGAHPQEHSDAFLKLRAALEQLAYLKSSAADHYKAGVFVEGENVPRKILGPGYTQGELVELAVERAAGKGAFGEDEIPGAVAAMRELVEHHKDDWDEVVEWERG